MTRRPLLLAAVLALLAPAAGSEPPEPDAPGPMEAVAGPDLREERAPDRKRAEPHGQALVQPATLQMRASAQAPGVRWLGLFADGMRFTVPHEGMGLDLRGGAYLQLLRNLSLSGSYRVFDYDGIPGDSTLETDYHGPLIGLSLRF